MKYMRRIFTACQRRNWIPRRSALLKAFLTIAFFLVVIFIPETGDYHEFPHYRIVLDPGHGGICLKPMEIHGDRYDSISEKYLDPFREGASYRQLDEHVIVYSIALKAKRILDLCSHDGDYKRFFGILRRYATRRLNRIVIDTHMSRPDSRNSDAVERLRDPNEKFRLFDFPGPDGEMKPGRISSINALKPQLVVSLHIATSGPPEYRGLNPVIVPPFIILHRGLQYLQGDIKNQKFFYNSKYYDWFSESTKRSDFDWFLKDVSVYFTGYPLKEDRTLDLEDFRGYRYNMITWAYRDPLFWECIARFHPEGTPYAKSHRGFRIHGRFWEREGSLYERYRRDGGYSGYGGDNLYASSEIIRYILLSLYRKNTRLHPAQKPTRPYISIWSVPLHVNAISAFIELGYLRISSHRKMLVRNQDDIAEGIAVGIYSLLAGLQLRDADFSYMPEGKRIDLNKYSMPNKESYFEAVTGD